MVGRVSDVSCNGKCVLGRPRRRYGISRNNSRSEGTIGALCALRMAALVWRGENEGEVGRGRGGNSD